MTLSTQNLVRRIVDCHAEQAPRIARCYLHLAIERSRVDQIALWRSVIRTCDELYPAHCDRRSEPAPGHAPGSPGPAGAIRPLGQV